MKTVGIIAEYNPLHNGHAYQLSEAKKQTGADYLIVAMSGDFLQRGLPAIVDKHTRAEMAIYAGADLVLELPAACAAGSASYFADGGIALLEATCVIDSICYGVETLNPQLLKDAAAILCDPAPSFETEVASLVKSGMTYPRARQEALICALPQYPAALLRTFFSTPNNILALEYEKAILCRNRNAGRQIKSLGILRRGDGYHENAVCSPYASATAIRRLVLSQNACDPALSALLPKHSLELLQEAADNRLLLTADDFSAPLYTKLLLEQSGGYTGYADCSQALSNRICAHLNDFVSFTQFAELLKTRDLTHTRINRVLTHILLSITPEDQSARSVPYLRVLGFRRSAEPLLSAIAKKASAPLITKVADAPRILSPDAMRALQSDINAADLYRGISRIKSGRPLSNEYNTPVTIPL